MIAIQDSKQRFESRARLNQAHPPHFSPGVTQFDFSQGLADQFHRLWELMRTAGERLDVHPVEIRRLFLIMDDVRDQLSTFFLWKEMFTDESEIALRFHRQASAIAAERADLYLDACEVADQARDLLFHSETPIQDRIEALKASFEDFCERLRSNERRETELVIRSAFEDIGVGD